MLEKDYTLEEVARALNRSPRWLRAYMKNNDVEHLRGGTGRNAKITFTARQVEKLRADLTRAAVEDQRITTGRKKAS